MALYFKYRIAYWFSKDDFVEKEKNFKESKICSLAKIVICVLDIIFFPLYCLLKLYKLAMNKDSVNKTLLSIVMLRLVLRLALNYSLEYVYTFKMLNIKRTSLDTHMIGLLG